MKRKIAVIMAADVAGYSRLVSENEDEALARLISYREIFSEFVSRGDGRIFNTAGDAVLAEFPSAVDALRAAIDIQESIRTRNLEVPAKRQMRFRIGMTVGDVVEQDGDLLGDGVNVAARLEGLSEPGGICVSSSLHEQVHNKITISFRDIGLKELKNIATPVRVFAVSPAGRTTPIRPARRRLPTRKAMAFATGAIVSASSLAVFGFSRSPWHLEGPSVPAAPASTGPGSAGAVPPWQASATPKPPTLNREPAPGTLLYGQVVLVDDGSCPSGQIKELTGGSSAQGFGRKRRCIGRPSAILRSCPAYGSGGRGRSNSASRPRLSHSGEGTLNCP